MKIVKFVGPREFHTVLCCVGNHWIPQDEAYFDVEGKPYVDYYCKEHLPQEPEELEDEAK